MKIAIISELTGGGVEKVNTLLAQKIKEQDHQIIVISMVTDPSVINKVKLPFDCIFLNKKSKSKAGRALILALREEKPDIVLTSCLMESYFAIIYNKTYSSNAKIIYVQHSVYSMTIGNSIKQRLLNDFLPHICKVFDRIDGVVFVSKGVKIDFNQYFPHYFAKNTIIFNPITDENAFFRYKEMDKLTLKLITAGRLEIEKKQETIIEALVLLRERGINVSLDILGKGSQKEYLMHRCKELNLAKNVFFHGYIENVLEKMANYDIFVLSSEHESFGNVIVEAMNIGLPVVSTNCPVGPNEILEGGEFGTLVAIGDSAAMADAIESVWKRHCIESVNAAYKRSLDFSVEKSVQSYIDFFTELMLGGA